MDADLRSLFTVPLVLFVVVVLFALLVVVLLVKVEGVFARGALNVVIVIIEEEEEVVVVVVGGEEEEDIPLLLLLFSSRSEERVRAWSSEDIFFFCIVFLSRSLLSLSLSLSLFFFFFFSLFRLLFFHSSSTSEIYNTQKFEATHPKRNNTHIRARVDEYKRASTTVK